MGLFVAGIARSKQLLMIAAVATAAAGCQPGGLFGVGPDTADLRVPEGTLDPPGAVQTLPALPVAVPANLAGYDRDCSPGHACVFGQAWSDDVYVAGGHNGCDTRNDLLARDLQAARPREPGGCVIVEGVLDDPYTGKSIPFAKENAGVVQVDHVVALAAAWRVGAAGWDPQKRQNFANDPRNLLVVDASVNQSKSDSTADEWMPPNASYHCEFARIVVTVKVAYGLAVTAGEQAALRSALERCTPPSTVAPSPG